MPARPPSRKPSTAGLSAAGPARNGRARGRSLSLSPALLADPIITLNATGVIESASDSVEPVFGWMPAELIGRNVKVLIPEPRRSALDRYLDRYRETDAGKAAQRTRRFNAMRKDGTVFQIELSMSRADLPLHGSPYFIGIVRDVSAQIDVSANAVEERTRLQHLVTEQTRALATANLQLQLTDRLTSLGTLAAGLGHDMNNVLLPVRARLNALENAGITPAAQVHVKAVRRSVAYLQHLSDGLHFLAMDPDSPGPATAAGGPQGVTHLAQWWRQVGMLLRKTVPAHVKLRASLPARLPPVGIAAHWLTQAVLNLLVNAAEALGSGHRRAEVRVWAQESADGSVVRLGVSDNGRGMAPGIRRRAFDLFFTTKVRTMGTGLGLPLARKVAIRAGGNVEIQSSPGKGTTVVLILPTVSARDARAAGGGTRAKGWATVSVQDHRAAALISQVLIAGGLAFKSNAGSGPGGANMWVTDPTAKALAAAVRWRGARAGSARGNGQGVSGRAVVLLGAPPKRARAKWAALGATIIDPPSDLEAIRHGLGEAAWVWNGAAQMTVGNGAAQNGAAGTGIGTNGTRSR